MHDVSAQNVNITKRAIARMIQGCSGSFGQGPTIWFGLNDIPRSGRMRFSVFRALCSDVRPRYIRSKPWPNSSRPITIPIGSPVALPRGSMRISIFPLIEKGLPTAIPPPAVRRSTCIGRTGPNPGFTDATSANPTLAVCSLLRTILFSIENPTVEPFALAAIWSMPFLPIVTRLRSFSAKF